MNLDPNKVKKGTVQAGQINSEEVIVNNLSGTPKIISAKCTHMGCTVAYNTKEQTLDCPCHGGKYDLNGKVISGPPKKDLPEIKM